MSNLAPFLISGIVAGTIYGLAATGLVVTYKTSGIFNFGHGAVGAAGAYLYYQLRDVWGVPWPVAMVATVAVAAPLFGALLSVVAAGLAEASPAKRVVATVGILVALQSLLLLIFGPTAPSPRPTFPTSTFEVFGTRVGYDQLITVGIAVAAVGALTLVFRSTRLGLQMRAVVDNPELLDLVGTRPARVRAAAWMIGVSFAALTGVLIAPTVGLDLVLLTMLVIQAVGAAAIGRFHHLAATFAGGLVIGVAQSALRSPAVKDHIPVLGKGLGLSDSVSFLALFLILILARRGVFTEPRQNRESRPAERSHSRGRMLAAGAVGLAAVAALPHIVTDRDPVLIQAAVFVTIFASLFLLVEVSGQVSLCHAAFVAIGATSFAHFTTGAGLPWLVGAALAVLVVLPIGAIVAIPAIRLSGLFLALATFGFGMVIERMAYTRPVMFGALGSRSASRPTNFDGHLAYFYLCAGLAALTIGLVVLIRRGRLGRMLEALSESPIALVTNGLSVNVTRVIVFCLAAAIAALGGVLYVGVVGSVSAVGASAAALTPFNSLQWIVILVLSGRSPVAAPVGAAIGLFIMPSYLNSVLDPTRMSVLLGTLIVVVVATEPAVRRRIGVHTARAAARRAHSPIRARTRRPTAAEMRARATL